MSLYIATAILTALTSIGVGIFVFLKNPKGSVNRTWFALSISVAFWSTSLAFMFNSKTPSSGLLYSRILQAGLIFIPSTHLHFVIALLDYPKKKTNIVNLCYLFSFIFLLLDFTPYLVNKAVYTEIVKCYYPRAGSLYIFYILFYFLSFGYAIYLMARSLISEKGFRKNQIAYVLTASAVGFIACSTIFPLWYDIQFPPVGAHFVWLYALIIAVAIARYQLMGITIVITTLGIFTLVYLLVLGVPFIIAYTLQPILSRHLGEKWWFLPLILMAILASAGPFFYSRMQRKAEARLRKDEIQAHKALNRLAQDMTRFTKLETLLKLIVRQIVKVMKVDRASIYLKDESGREYCIKATWGIYGKLPPRDRFLENSSLVQDILIRRVPIVFEEFRYSQISRMSSHLKRLQYDLERARATVVIPAFKRNDLFGFLTIGAKTDNSIFTKEDLDIFTSLTNQAVLAIDNARAYEELMNTRDQLIKVEKLATLGKFSSEVAHEIKNPLQGIKAFTELIKEKYDDRDFREKFSRLVAAEVDRIDNFVRQLIRFAHPLPPKFGNVDINEVLNSVFELMGNDFANNNILVKKQYEMHPIIITADKDQLKQVFLNLVTNAIDAMRSSEKRVLTVSTSCSQSYATIKMADTGCGIPPESISQLFSPTFTTKERGTGLGLSIVDTIIKNHKGKIDVKSEVGRGTTFTINIPVEQPAMM